MFKKSLYSVIITSFFLLNACTSLKTDIQIDSIDYPKAFIEDMDTANIANIYRQEFFKDTMLVNLIEIALTNNFDLQIALQRIEIARSYVKLSDAELLPKSTAVLQSSLEKFGRYTMDGAGNIDSDITPGKKIPENLADLYIGFETTWEIDIWGKLRNRKKAAFSDFLASIEATNFIITNLIAEVAHNYYELLALDNELNIIRQTIGKQTEALEIIRNIKESGRTTEIAVQQFSAQLLNLQGLEKEVRQNIYELENKINFLIGRLPQTIERKKEILYEETPHKIVAGIPAQLLQNRPDIREAELQIKASQFELLSAKAAFYPTLNLSAGIGFQSFDPSFLFISPASIAYSVVGGLIAPIINLNDLKAKFQYATALQLQTLHYYQKTILNAYVEVINELSKIKYLDELQLLKEKENVVLNQSVDTSLELYKAAKTNYLDVLISQQNVFNSSLELVNINKKKKITTVNLYKALGGGWK